MPNKTDNKQPEQNDPNNNNNSASSLKPELLKCFSEFFKRDLITIPVVKKYPHPVVQQRCGLKAATLELDTAAYPNIEYVAGTRLSVFPLNPSNHVSAVLEHLVDDLSPNKDTIALPPNSAWWAKFVQLNKGDSLRLALTHLFDITIAPSRELIRVVSDHCLTQSTGPVKDLRRRLAAVSCSNEAWEKWLCSGQRTLKGLFDEVDAAIGSSSSAKQQHHNQPAGVNKSLPASKLFGELEIQAPRQYSISNIKSSKRFRTEIIVFQHKFNCRQIELNLRQLKERDSFDNSVSSPKSPSTRSNSVSAGRGATSSPSPPTSVRQQATPSQSPARAAGGRRASGPPQAIKAIAAAATSRNVSESSERSGRSMSTRSIRSLAPQFASSPPISTHQVKQVSSFSGPVMSMYATASTTGGAGANQPEASTSGPLDQAAASSRRERLRSRMSLVSAPEPAFSDPTGAAGASSPPAPSPSGSGGGGGGKSAPQTTQFDGLCSNYLLNLNTNDQILCEFVENPRFTLKGNRERPIMMIGQDVGLVAFRAFWQQRNLEHDRAQVFYTLFKDLSPKKFGEMQLVCVTGHKCRIEELLFRREINLALTSKVLSSVTYINRKHLVAILSAAHTKSQLLFAQYNSTAAKSLASSVARSSAVSSAASQLTSGSNLSNSLQITNKELLELGDRIYKLLVEHTGCLYTCCDPHMTQAIEILLFESIARNNSQLTRERITQLLPKWKGRDTSASGSGRHVSGSSRSRSRSTKPSGGQQQQQETDGANNAIYTLENTYERARIVQEIYDNSI